MRNQIRTPQPGLSLSLSLGLGLWLWLALAGVARAGALEEAEALLVAQQPVAAMERLQAHLAARPEDTPAQELYIDILLSAGLSGAARQRAAELAQARPASADAWYLLGRASMDPEEAQRAYSRALELDPDHARSRMGWAALYRARGEHDAARQGYQQALAADPSLAEAWIGLWSSQLALGDRRGAAQTAQQASAAIPAVPEAWLARAALEPDRARQHLAEGLRHSPAEPRLLNGHARQAFLARGLEAARAAYARATAASPDDAALRVEAEMLEEIARSRLTWEGAQGLIDARAEPRSAETTRRVDGIIGQHPRSALARVVRGNLRQMQGDKAGAVADLEAAVALDARSASANAALGLLLLSERRPAEAIPYLQAASAERPRDVALAIAAAVALAEGRDVGAGGLALLELEARFPDSPAPALALARMLMGMGEHERAMTVLSDALARVPDTNLMLALAAAARAAGRPAEAARILTSLAERTGDPRFSQAARQLLSEAQD